MTSKQAQGNGMQTMILKYVQAYRIDKDEVMVVMKCFLINN